MEMKSKFLQSTVLLAIVSLLALSMAGSAVMAQEGGLVGNDSGGAGFCSGDSADSAFVNLIKNIATLVIVGGPVAGIVMAAFYTTASSAKPGEGDDYSKKRRNALIAGFSVPVIAYGGSFVISEIFNFGMGCFLP